MNHKTSNRQSWTLLAILAVLMALTRFHHEGTAVSLPDASLAVFFLGGLYLRSSRSFLLLLVLAFIVDFVAISGFGVSDYCLSPAYVFLVPTYGALWLGGRWLSRQYRAGWPVFITQSALSLMVSASLAFLVSNGSFFWFSGKVSSVGILDYFLALSEHYLPYVGAAFAYAAMGIGMEALLKSLPGLLPSKILNR